MTDINNNRTRFQLHLLKRRKKTCSDRVVPVPQVRKLSHPKGSRMWVSSSPVQGKAVNALLIKNLWELIDSVCFFLYFRYIDDPIALDWYHPGIDSRLVHSTSSTRRSTAQRTSANCPQWYFALLTVDTNWLCGQIISLQVLCWNNVEWYWTSAFWTKTFSCWPHQRSLGRIWAKTPMDMRKIEVRKGFYLFSAYSSE